MYYLQGPIPCLVSAIDAQIPCDPAPHSSVAVNLMLVPGPLKGVPEVWALGGLSDDAHKAQS